MVPEKSYLRQIPRVLNPTQAIKVEALVFAADTIETSLAFIRRITEQAGRDICGAPRSLQTQLFLHAWAIVHNLDSARQMLDALDYRTELGKKFHDKYRQVRSLRNKISHLRGNAQNLATSKGRQPVFGSLAYIHIPSEFITAKDGETVIAGGATVLLAAGSLQDGGLQLANPAGRTLSVPVGGFRLSAFGETIELDEAENDLRALMLELDINFEKQITEMAETLAKHNNVPIEKLLESSLSGFSTYLVFSLNDRSDDA